MRCACPAQAANLVQLPGAPAAPLRGAVERVHVHHSVDALLATLSAAINAGTSGLRSGDRDALFERAINAAGPARLEALARWAAVSVPRRRAFVDNA